MKKRNSHSSRPISKRAAQPKRTKAESPEARRKRAARIAAALAKLYPDARISLNFSNAWECLVATILSAQCTDERVNQVTPALFRAIRDVRAMANAPLPEIERLIVRTGFFRQKAKSLRAAAQTISEKFRREVPSRMEDLVQLPGVGRKTANVILGHIYGQPGVVVDTHVRRVAYRLGLTISKDPEEIELDLQQLLPPKEWTKFSMRLILHGRRICVARRPLCEKCLLLPDCPRNGLEAKQHVAVHP